MHTTSPTLLERVRRPDDQEAWRRFVSLYTPLLFNWASRLGLQSSDASDLVQDVFALLVHKLPEFQYDQSQSFRAWLRTVLRNKWFEQKRRRSPLQLAEPMNPLDEPAVPNGDGDGFDAIEYQQQLVQQALRIVQADFQPTTWRAWSEYVIAGRPAHEVAAELGLTVHAVYLVKTRVLRRLREELSGFLEE